LRIANIEDFGKVTITDKRTILNLGCYCIYICKKPKNLKMGVWQQLAEYLYIRKKDPNAPQSSWMKYMHGINRISLFMFILAIIVIILKITILKKH
jgi:hypothetical protein